ncbi:hypothetical protein CMUS01_15319 [Colletotrichum musicola]|uniref:Uncharacterized protein n=1 Tax=Colletotrichum musicola TaxID=2175873 RepID=A0A8H6IX73_9PEZI|nr:hypothetical protein CMUS01_15319 [Colletotrichum musicola]
MVATGTAFIASDGSLTIPNSTHSAVGYIHHFTDPEATEGQSPVKGKPRFRRTRDKGSLLPEPDEQLQQDLGIRLALDKGLLKTETVSWRKDRQLLLQLLGPEYQTTVF